MADAHTAARNVVSLHDDAQLMDAEALEVIHRLYNFDYDCKVVQILPLGQSEMTSLFELNKAVNARVSPLLAAHADDLLLDPVLFARVKAVFEAREGLKLNAEQVSIAGQIAFEQLALDAGNLDGFINLRKLRLKEQDQSLAKAALELKVKQYEDKISAARASLEKAKSKGGLNKTTLELIEEQLRLL